ncbi:MAG TPA: hydrogenase subunit MbhD domain-containing protein [Rubrobacter sp.]|nr:hydrogenase subunit MbhD domain-containing protein [Rubrobacter sp.]
MTQLGWVFDALLAGSLPLLAWRVLATRDLFKAVILFITFGLLVAISWARLGAPDIALAEAAIGAGITGALFLNTLGGLAGEKNGAQRGSEHGYELPVDHRLRRPTVRLLIAVPTLIFGLALAWAVLSFPEPPVGLAGRVQDSLRESGVSNPITAVLLNFRGYDTLLEVGVLLLAVVGVWSLGLSRRGATTEEGPVLSGLARLLAPVMVLVAGYLLYAGTKTPGGAFQAGAVLGALGVLLLLAGLVRPPLDRGRVLRAGLTLGFGVFLAVGCAGLLFGHLMEYPPGWAYPLILLVEAVLTVSIALTLAALFVAAPPESSAHTREVAPEEIKEEGG